MPRKLPYNNEAEKSVLGIIMVYGSPALARVAAKLYPDHFMLLKHNVIYSIMLELDEDGIVIDPVTVRNRLEEKNKLKLVGGAVYLNSLMDAAVTVESIEYYADIIIKKAAFRSIIEASSELYELGQKDDLDVATAIGRAEEIMAAATQSITIDRNAKSVRDVLLEHLPRLEALQHAPDGYISGIPTGFIHLDEMLSGLHNAELIVLAGRPSMGKSALALTMVRNMALKHGKSCGVFSLEMTEENIVERMLCGEAKIDMQRLRKGYISPNQWRDLVNASNKLAQAKIYIDDTPGISIDDIRLRARQMHNTYGIDLIVVDYMQLVEAKQRSREQEVSHIVRMLKRLARELDIPIIAISQLNRRVDKQEKGHKTPRLSDLRESGEIEQTADVVMFIHRDDYYMEKTNDMPDVVTAEIIVAKQRNGPVGVTEVAFHRRFADFYPLAYDVDN